MEAKNSHFPTVPPISDAGNPLADPGAAYFSVGDPATTYSFSWITKDIMIGNRLCSADPGFAVLGRFQSILALTSSAAPAPETRLQLRSYSWMDLKDGKDHEHDVFLRVVDDLAEMVRFAPPVLVCSHSGQNRSAAVIAGYLVKHLGYTFEHAFAAIQKHREINVSRELINAVRVLDPGAKPPE